MHPYALPLIRSIFRKNVERAIEPIEKSLGSYVAPESKVEIFRNLTHYPNNGYLPITWPFIAAWRGHLENLTHPTFPLKLPGIVHIKNHIFQKRPIGSGEQLTITCRIETDPPSDKGIAFALVTDVYAKEEICWSSRSSMLSIRKQQLPLTKPRHSLSPDGLGSKNRYWAIPAHVARKYAILSGDINPIHLSKIFALPFGFRGVVIHGNWILSRIAAEHEDLLKRTNINFNCHFKKPIILPAQVIYRFWEENNVIHFRVLCPRSQGIFVHGTISWDSQLS